MTAKVSIEEVLRESLHAANAEMIRLRTELIAMRADNRMLKEKQDSYISGINKASWWEVLLSESKARGYTDPFNLLKDFDLFKNPNQVAIDKHEGSWYSQGRDSGVYPKINENHDESKSDLSGS
jgi:hypothetical protein